MTESETLGAFGEVAGTLVRFNSSGTTEVTRPSDIDRLLEGAKDEVIVGLVMLLTGGQISPDVVRAKLKLRREAIQ